MSIATKWQRFESADRCDITAYLGNVGLGMPARAAEPAALPAAKSETAMPQPVERASAEDCAIIVEIEKAKMNWGAPPPEFAFLSSTGLEAEHIWRTVHGKISASPTL